MPVTSRSLLVLFDLHANVLRGPYVIVPVGFEVSAAVVGSKFVLPPVVESPSLLERRRLPDKRFMMPDFFGVVDGDAAGDPDLGRGDSALLMNSIVALSVVSHGEARAREVDVVQSRVHLRSISHFGSSVRGVSEFESTRVPVRVPL